jgi:hypothetical protein
MTEMKELTNKDFQNSYDKYAQRFKGKHEYGEERNFLQCWKLNPRPGAC